MVGILLRFEQVFYLNKISQDFVFPPALALEAFQIHGVQIDRSVT